MRIAKWTANAVIAMAACSAISSALAAETRRIDCSQQSDAGVRQVVRVLLTDDSDSAEVQLYATTVPCAATASCPKSIYTKQVLPTSIRLSNSVGNAIATLNVTIDIDRSTLAVVTRIGTKSESRETVTSYTGTCQVTTTDLEQVL